MTIDDGTVQLLTTAAQAAARVKAQRIVAIDVTSRLPLTDAFLLASGTNENQVSAIVREVENDAARLGRHTMRREGLSEGRWALLDFGDVIVHVQHAQDRDFYGLDRLWKDCPTVPLPGVETGDGGAGEDIEAARLGLVGVR
ncbi:MAG: ribosome silencing factor [Bifidobacteriaceae bacterium]|jgi:ribosome-associated protein|nr:ribosome silencing factor [Bifidobacteriaceae bacterium]